MANKGLKMCQSCRGLIDAGASVCPLCGAEGHYVGRALAVSGSVTLNHVLMAANLVIYVLVLLYQTKVLGQPVQGSGLGVLAPSRDIVVYAGVVYGPFIAEGEYWRLIAACFLHGNLLHLGFNCFALYQIGGLAEETYGRAKYLCLYLVAGFAGWVAVMAVGQSALGASGAIFGVIGAMAVYGYKRRDSYGRALKASMVQWIIYSLVMSLMPGISMAAHVGGLIGGGLMAFFLDDAEQTAQSLRRIRLWQIAGAAALVIMVAGLLLAGLNVRRETEVARVKTLNSSVAGAVAAYFEYFERLADRDELGFDRYRRQFSSDVTTLEQAGDVDGESAALRSQMLDILRARREQLQQASGFANSSPERAQATALEQKVGEYLAWRRRKAESLGVSDDDLRDPPSQPRQSEGRRPGRS